MGKVEIFKDVTTEDILLGLEAESEKYTGLYVEMGNAEERKYVKGKALCINDMLKVLDRARIDKSRDFKVEVEKEAATIKLRLEDANKPFTLLIDEYTAERKKILDAKKAKEEAIELANKKELDHELALLLDMKIDADAKELARLAADELAEIKRKAAEQAAIDEQARQQGEKDRIQREKVEAEQREEAAKLEAQQAIEREAQAVNQAKIDAKNAEVRRIEDARLAEVKRLADIEAAKQKEINRQAAEVRAKKVIADAKAADIDNQARVHNDMVADFVALGLCRDDARLAVKGLAKSKVRHAQVNY